MHTETFRILKKLESHPTFGVEAISSLLKTDADYAKVYLNRMEKKGIIQKIQRNVYTVQKDPLVIASRIIWPSYISLWSALRYYNLTEQLPNEISVLTTSAKSRRIIEFMNVTIAFNRIKPEYFFGFSKVLIGGFEIFMAEPEKAILDAILLKKASFSEVYSIMKENSRKLSMKRFVEYTIATGNAAASKRIGWMLDSLGFSIAAKLRPMAYRTPIPLDYARPHSGGVNGKWGVIVNIGGE